MTAHVNDTLGTKSSSTRLIIISGRSGSGKTTALHVLEDIGYYCVDNLPVTLLPALALQLTLEANPPVTKIAVGIDARNNPGQLQKFSEALEALAPLDIEIDVIYLDADSKTLLKRFSETRRKHPGTGANTSLSEAIEKEQQLLDPIARAADLKIETSSLNLHDLRDLIQQRISTEREGMALLFKSFGFKYGIPIDADLVFDARCLPNPYWVPELRSQSGLDQDVKTFLSKEPSVEEMQNDIISYLENWLPKFAAANRSYMTVAIGCTGGHHRSVYLTETLQKHFKSAYSNTQARHRDL
ncbi:RNase adaptor protein RapZ [Gammaproteobacteria bacterium 42_54_T18]|nr:RNase adaptor protein RapZ [Gammaproteobacteria bacterium 42_54_T18]